MKRGTTLDPVLNLVRDFLATSSDCVTALVEELAFSKTDTKEKITFSTLHAGGRRDIQFGDHHYFLRTSTEYSSPQLTLEEVQGIIAARLLETCGNYFETREERTLEHKDLLEIAENLRKPPRGRIIPFALNTDDVEPDRYSNNPLRASITDSGQSAFAVAKVKTSDLKIDPHFVTKYEGSLISNEEADFIKKHLRDTNNYLDFVDFVKYDALERLSEILEIHLCLPFIRMPLTVLAKETRHDPLHLIIGGSHRDRDAVEAVYKLMGRSIKKKRTLLTVPHSLKGFASKRAAKGRLIFDGYLLDRVDVRYRTMQLYPNMADPDDISVARADDVVSVEAQNLIEYEYTTTPSSPQFALYIILSTENASLSHGVGEWAGSNILKSYCSLCEAFVNNRILEEVPRTHLKRPPLALNLIPDKMWLHPKYENLDASMGCIDNPLDLLNRGMAVEHLAF